MKGKKVLMKNKMKNYYISKKNKGRNSNWIMTR